MRCRTGHLLLPRLGPPHTHTCLSQPVCWTPPTPPPQVPHLPVQAPFLLGLLCPTWAVPQCCGHRPLPQPSAHWAATPLTAHAFVLPLPTVRTYNAARCCTRGTPYSISSRYRLLRGRQHDPRATTIACLPHNMLLHARTCCTFHTPARVLWLHRTAGRAVVVLAMPSLYLCRLLP